MLMTPKIKLHDGIVGGLIAISVALGAFVDARWLALTGLTAAIMLSSSVTGFCPVHWAISKFVKD